MRKRSRQAASSSAREVVEVVGERSWAERDAESRKQAVEIDCDDADLPMKCTSQEPTLELRVATVQSRMSAKQELRYRDLIRPALEAYQNDEIESAELDRRKQKARKESQDDEKLKQLNAAAAAYTKARAAAEAARAALEGLLDTYEKVTELNGHTNEVFTCAWSPTSMQLASGSGDSTVRIWCASVYGQMGLTEPHVLQHYSTEKEKSKDVTTLDWNYDGSFLATASYDGQARIWSSSGKLTATLSKHKGPIFTLKWNSSGRYLLSGSVDKTAIIWDAHKGAVLQQFACHKEPTLDVDWRDEDSFASCSTDRMIYVCKLGQENFLKRFEGHKDEVNTIKWDPSGKLLASCSDDHTAKVWSMSRTSCLHNLTHHTKQVYSLNWSPTGPGSNKPDAGLMLATACFDSTVRVWDARTGKCLHVLSKHTDPVYSVSFSTNGLYLASGSFDRWLHIWNVRDGSLMQSFHGQGGIFEVCWNVQSTQVAACFSNNTVIMLDVHADP